MSAQNIVKLKQQILSSSDSTKWTGEGRGSSDANAEDMAKIMDGIGITDITQFGQIEKVIPAQEQQFEGGDGFSSVMIPEHTVTVFGNKATGQEVPNTYGERQTDNYFGGTYAGKGNTGYGVQFDANGNPRFYTSGASSSDMGTVAPLLTMAGMAFGAPYLSELFGGLGGAELGLAADADLAAGLIPEFGSNAAYSGFMSGAMTPAAIAAMDALVAASPEVIGSGALLTDAAATAANTAGTTAGTTAAANTSSATSGLTATQIANLAKAGISVAGLLGGTAALTNTGGGGTTTTGGVPTSTTPMNTQDYYKAIQQSYNQLMPNAPRDVATPLQNWYANDFNPGTSVVNSLFGNVTGGISPTVTTPQIPVTQPTPYPVQPTPVYPTSTGTATTTTGGTKLTTAPATPTLAPTGLLSNSQVTPQDMLKTLLAAPNVQDLPEETKARISAAVNAPRSYEEVVSSGSTNTVDMSKLTPEQVRAYDIYQQTQITGAPTTVVNAAYQAAGIDPTNPGAYFDKLGLNSGMPTQEAIAKYAPTVLDKFASGGGGNLLFAVNPTTVPKSSI